MIRCTERGRHCIGRWRLAARKCKEVQVGVVCTWALVAVICRDAGDSGVPLCAEVGLQHKLGDEYKQHPHHKDGQVHVEEPPEQDKVGGHCSTKVTLHVLDTGPKEFNVWYGSEHPGNLWPPLQKMGKEFECTENIIAPTKSTEVGDTGIIQWWSGSEVIKIPKTNPSTSRFPPICVFSP